MEVVSFNVDCGLAEWFIDEGIPTVFFFVDFFLRNKPFLLELMAYEGFVSNHHFESTLGCSV